MLPATPRPIELFRVTVCTVDSFDIGVAGCAALAGAAGNAVTYGLQCSESHSCSVGGAVEAVGLGALGGALGAGLAGPLGGKLVATALEDVMPKVAASALVGLGSGAASGAVTSAVGYGMSCGSSPDGCSLSGAASAVGSGAMWGGLIGAGAGVQAFGRAGGGREHRLCHAQLRRFHRGADGRWHQQADQSGEGRRPGRELCAG